MNNLDKLASICSELYTSYSDDEKSSSKNAVFDPNKSKSNIALNFTCVNDIRNLHPKGLVEKFSQPTSDEIKRRYSYKCVILPEECDTVYESYGNEKKASDNMKHHLQLHLRDLEDRILSGNWPPKIDENKVFPSQNGSKRSLKFEHPLGVKMPRKKDSRSRKNPPRERGNGLRKPPKLRITDLDSHKTNNLVESKHGGFVVNTKVEPKEEKAVVEEIVQDLTVEICGPLCSHADCSLSQSSTKANGWNEFIVQSIILEHSYAWKRGGNKPQAESPPPFKNVRSSSRRGCCILPELVIKTPPFPYVHVPLLPDCAGIEIVMMEGELVHNTSDGQETSSNEDPVVTVKQLNKRIPSSVLECVENRVDVSSIRVPNSPSLSPEHSNEENAENVQKAEREKALRYISKLKAKKNKKQYQGPLVCQICKHKKFTALATLIHHYRSHAGIKPYSCKLCEGTFTRKHSLNYHMLIHKNISRFTCPSCFRAFRHPSHYKEHLRRHTGETPFICPTCLLKFKTRNTFKRHLKIQHGKLLTAHGILDLPSLDAEA